jgi:nucleotide-binding universal stress UspA family protein
MHQLKHIMAATDLSINSQYAVERGYRIAKKTGAQYTLIHALGLDSINPLKKFLGKNIDAFSKRMTEEAMGLLTEMSSPGERNLGLAARLQLEPGAASTAIPDFASTHNIDLMLIGAHGKDFLERVLLGSTASTLLRKSKCPILIIKQQPAGDYRRALITIDFSPVSESVIRHTRSIAADADIVLMHVYEVLFEGKMHFAGVSEDIIGNYRDEEQQRATQQLHDLAKSAGLSKEDYSVLVVYGNATRQVIQHEQQLKCDLLVMGKHGTHVTEELLFGSVTNHILAESRCDVLVVTDKRRPVMDLVDD